MQRHPRSGVPACERIPRAAVSLVLRQRQREVVEGVEAMGLPVAGAALDGALQLP